jgi:MoaA/NifB/PqqE/SkfB family radical SAM enzyme
MLKFRNIKSIQIEISTYCNSACPQCPRNYYGGATISTVPLYKWSLSEFKKIFSDEVLDQIEQVYFCGTYGDPMTNRAVLSMCQYLKKKSNIKVGIHTNGGVDNESMYSALAQHVDFLAFGIDGLEDTNHIYRRHVNWDRVIKNAQAFINAGGNAIWDYIVFEHNEHQVDTARELSKILGFQQFNVKQTSRFLRRDHKYSESLDVYNRSGTIDYTISIPKNVKYLNTDYQKLVSIDSLDQYVQSTAIDCNACRIKEVYIAANGFVFPCGWLHDRMYGTEVESHPDHLKLSQMIASAGGYKNTNIFHSSLSEILNGPWFDIIEQSWSDNRLERCAIMCGSDINLIGNQNLHVKYN